MAAASNPNRSGKSEQRGLPLTVPRMMGFVTAAALLGGIKNLADHLGISERGVAHKIAGDRGISDDDLRGAAEALNARAAKLAGHAAKLRAEIPPTAATPAPIADGVPA